MSLIISIIIIVVLVVYVPIAIHAARKYKINSIIKILLLSFFLFTGCAEAGVGPWPGGRRMRD